MERTKSECLGLEFTSLPGKDHIKLKQAKMQVSIMSLIILTKNKLRSEAWAIFEHSPHDLEHAYTYHNKVSIEMIPEFQGKFYFHVMQSSNNLQKRQNENKVQRN